MAAFLSKVFSRKKADEKEPSSTTKRASVHSLLDGRFEAISPPVSPSLAKFSDTQHKVKAGEREKDSGKDRGPGLSRSRSRQKSPTRNVKRDEVPHLTLNFPGPKVEEKTGRPLVVFEAGSDGQVSLDDAVLGQRRLSPAEALLLIRACSEVISAKGLETLGIMHPHWHSASPAIQQKLISLFISSLTSKAAHSTLTSSPTDPTAAFESELNYVRSPHDAAAVLRWGLRHLAINGGSFGKKAQLPFAWYDDFAEAERTNSYPLKAFTDLLVPQLPPAHVELLLATLDMISSLAARSEMNGISGSKLSMFFGHYLLTGNKTDHVENWQTFYAQWERAGRILEHLFLSHIRAQSVKEKIPMRLVELIKSYPYAKPGSSSTTFPRPRLSTRTYDALYVRVNTEIGEGEARPKPQHPLRLIADALRAPSVGNSDYQAIWEAIKNAGAQGEKDCNAGEGDTASSLSRIFSDETIRLLSLRPTDDVEKRGTPPITMFTTAPDRVASRRRSSSLGSPHNGHANGHAKSNGDAKSPAYATSASPTQGQDSPIIGDWSLFSSAGFGETSQSLAATLLDSEVEKTKPASASKRWSGRAKLSPGHSRRSSVDNHTRQPSSPRPTVRSTSAAIVAVVQLDEAFIDFWSDALLDSITATWPAFVVCQLKVLPALSSEHQKINWLVIEQAYSGPDVKAPESSLSPPTSPLPRSASPRPSIRSSESTAENRLSRVSSTFSATRKRFGFFTSSKSHSDTVPGAESKTPRKAAKGVRIGEMGEIIQEERALPAPKANPIVVAEHARVPAVDSGATSADVARGAAVVAGAATIGPVVAQKATQETDPVPPARIEEEPVVAPKSVTPEPPAKDTETAVVEALVEPAQEATTPVVEEAVAEPQVESFKTMEPIAEDRAVSAATLDASVTAPETTVEEVKAVVAVATHTEPIPEIATTPEPPIAAAPSLPEPAVHESHPEEPVTTTAPNSEPVVETGEVKVAKQAAAAEPPVEGVAVLEPVPVIVVAAPEPVIKAPTPPPAPVIDEVAPTDQESISPTPVTVEESAPTPLAIENVDEVLPAAVTFISAPFPIAETVLPADDRSALAPPEPVVDDEAEVYTAVEAPKTASTEADGESPAVNNGVIPEVPTAAQPTTADESSSPRSITQDRAESPISDAEVPEAAVAAPVGLPAVCVGDSRFVEVIETPRVDDQSKAASIQSSSPDSTDAIDEVAFVEAGGLPAPVVPAPPSHDDQELLVQSDTDVASSENSDKSIVPNVQDESLATVTTHTDDKDTIPQLAEEAPVLTSTRESTMSHETAPIADVAPEETH